MSDHARIWSLERLATALGLAGVAFLAATRLMMTWPDPFLFGYFPYSSAVIGFVIGWRVTGLWLGRGAGALAQDAVLGAVTGAQPRLQSAHLSGAALWQDKGPMGCFPWLYPHENARCDGVLLSLENDGRQVFDGLAYLAEALGMVPVPKHVARGNAGEAIAAVTFLATAAPGPDAQLLDAFDPDDWQRTWGSIAAHACGEILSYMERTPAAALDWRMGMILTRAAARARAEVEPAPATLRSATPRDAVAVERSETPHAGFFLTQVHQLTPPRFDGGAGQKLRREVFVAADAALVLPYDPVRDRVLLIEQFRMGPFGRGDPLPFVLEPVAGHVDAGETPEEAAHRETAEEAGISLRALHHISSHYCSPGGSTEVFHCYLGLADLPEPGQGTGGLDTEHEDSRREHAADPPAASVRGDGLRDLGKAEFLNPGQSVKDRAALYIIRDAIARGDLRPAAPSSRAPPATPGSALRWWARRWGFAR
jgi:ADP-ribose pyrophosphatase